MLPIRWYTLTLYFKGWIEARHRHFIASKAGHLECTIVPLYVCYKMFAITVRPVRSRVAVAEGKTPAGHYLSCNKGILFPPKILMRHSE